MKIDFGLEPEPEIDAYGTKRWKNEEGKLHRIGGPAVEYLDGSKAWYVNGEKHRIDGPAVMWAGGYKAYWINGRGVNARKVEKEIKCQ